jgi:hypothetical protein
VLLRAEPTKQKTRRPERRGITRAVSPKKMREEEKEMPSLRIVGEEETRTTHHCVRFKGCNPRHTGSGR